MKQSWLGPALEGAEVRGECGSRGPAAAAIGGRHPVERSRIPWHS